MLGRTVCLLLSFCFAIAAQEDSPAAAAARDRALLEREPVNAVVMNHLAMLLADSGGDLEMALPLAQRARQLRPEVDEFAGTVGWIYLKLNRPVAAIEVFRGLVDRKPANARYRYRFGMALVQAGDDTAGAEQLERALQLVPPREDVRKILELLARLRH